MQIFKDWDRMCKSFEGCHDGDGCEIMKIIENTGEATNCGKFVRENPERAIEIIERWIKEHPSVTYKTDFLNSFPHAALDRDGYPIACRKDIYGGFCETGNYFCRDCWNELII